MSQVDKAKRIKSLATEYLRVCVASERACAIRGLLEVGASRAKITTANARWMCAAEARDRIFNSLREEINR